MLLEVDDLTTCFETGAGAITAVDRVSFQLRRGETLAVVGESGSGKSAMSLSIMGLVAPPGRVRGGRIALNGVDLLAKTEREMRAIRGRNIAMIFQEPMTSLNPVHTVGHQIAEAVRLHKQQDRAASMRAAIEMLDLVGIPEPARRARAYPHQLSGGMRQRAVIAMALSCGPELLIADEPTTALDVTIQAQILDLMRRLQRELGMGILFITHDLGVVAELADRVLVMYAGQVVEQAEARALFARPRMPYTVGLLRSVPRVDKAAARQQRLVAIPGNVPNPLARPAGCAFHPRCQLAIEPCREQVPALEDTSAGHLSRCLRWRDLGAATEPAFALAAAVSAAPGPPLLEARGLQVHFPLRGGFFSRSAAKVRAVEDVSFTVRQGEVVGLVGESGSGKTTVGRAILQLVQPNAGEIIFDRRPLARSGRAERRALRKDVQIIFQDPFGSLNPRMTVGDIIGEAFTIHGLARGRERRERIADLLARVGLAPDHVSRYPHEFSGGQRQRIGIARALAVSPRLIVADEPVSALDVSIQAQVINLLQDLKDQLGLTLLFIAHDLGVVEYISDRVVVMYLGRVMETAPARALYANPVHPYTEALLASVPIPDPAASRTRTPLTGEIPSPIDPPSGCVFRTRCPIAVSECAQIVPPLTEVSPGHAAACIRRI